MQAPQKSCSVSVFAVQFSKFWACWIDEDVCFLFCLCFVYLYMFFAAGVPLLASVIWWSKEVMLRKQFSSIFKNVFLLYQIQTKNQHKDGNVLVCKRWIASVQTQWWTITKNNICSSTVLYSFEVGLLYFHFFSSSSFILFRKLYFFYYTTFIWQQVTDYLFVLEAKWSEDYLQV